MLHDFQVALAVLLLTPCMACAKSGQSSDEIIVPGPAASSKTVVPMGGNPGDKAVIERDGDGRSILKIIYGRDGAVRQTTTFDCYDGASGQLTGWTARSYEPASTIDYSEEKCRFDPRLRCVEKTAVRYRNGKPAGPASHRIVEVHAPAPTIMWAAARQDDMPALTVPVDRSFFNANEFSLNISAGGAFGNDLRQVTTTQSVTTTMTQTQTQTVTRDNPNGPGDITETTSTSTDIKHTKNIQHTQNKGSFRGAAGKVELQANYFLTKHFGAGVNCGYIYPQQSTLLIDGRLIARYPIEGKWHVAPYAFTGMGGEFSNES